MEQASKLPPNFNELVMQQQYANLPGNNPKIKAAILDSLQKTGVVDMVQAESTISSIKDGAIYLTAAVIVGIPDVWAGISFIPHIGGCSFSHDIPSNGLIVGAFAGRIALPSNCPTWRQFTLSAQRYVIAAGAAGEGYISVTFLTLQNIPVGIFIVSGVGAGYDSGICEGSWSC
jgi:hypothetical protein